MAKKPASKRFEARLIVHAVIQVPLVANSFEEALEAAKQLTPTDAVAVADGASVNDWTSELQAVENGVWIEY